MSEEQLKAFLEAVNADEGLQEKLKASSDVDAVVAIAKDVGFVITAEQLKKALVEISEEDLVCVAGGGPGATVGWAFANLVTCGIPIAIDAVTGAHITRAAQNY